MIRYALRCERDHAFESWFQDSSAFETQVKRKLVNCPICNSVKVEKAIMAANLGLTPSTEGQVLRLRVPELNEERRKDLVKVAHKYAEAARVAVRHVRRDGLDVLKRLEKDHKISEDDGKRSAEQVQKATDEAITEVDRMLATKEKEILTV